MALGTSDGDVLAREGDQRALPLAVAEGGRALEFDLYAIN